MSTINTFLTAMDTAGNVQVFNAGTSDNSVPIFYELETQDIEFGDRSHKKRVSNKMGVVSKLAEASSLKVSENGEDYVGMLTNLPNRVNVLKNINLEANFVNFKWSGNTTNVSPVFEGLYLEDISDLGMVK